MIGSATTPLGQFRAFVILANCAALAALLGCGDGETPVVSPADSPIKPAAAEERASLQKLLADPTASRTLAASGTLIRPRFRDVAASHGIRFRRFSDIVPGRFFLPEVMGGGAAWIDFDGDGALDLYVVEGCRLVDPDPHQTTHVNRLYVNRGNGGFQDVTAPSHAGDNRYAQGCAVGDFNADGFPDLHIANYGRNTLLANQGDGTFEDVTQVAGVGDESWGTSCLWFDADGDGDLDLYVVNYVDCTLKTHKTCQYDGRTGYCGPGTWNGVQDVVYLNRGDGRFVESARALGFETPQGKGLAIVAADFDDDLLPEVYVANDMTANFLFTRRRGKPMDGNRLYRDVAERAGCALSGDGRNEASMGIATGDFDGDGRPDIFLSHFYQAKNTLYRNLGSLNFEDESHRTRIAANSFNSLGFGTVAFDYDRDGDQDLFVANGHVLGPAHTPNEMTAQLLENDGRGIFADISSTAGKYFHKPVLGRGVAAADYDNDGDIDIAVTHVDHPLSLLRNDTETGRSFIGFDLRTPNRIVPVGGRVVVQAGKRRFVVPITAGGSYLSSGDSRLVIGLGAHRGNVSVEIHWPSGRVDPVEKLPVDRYWYILEGKRPLSSVWLPASGVASP
jgi:hypothetical protein